MEWEARLFGRRPFGKFVWLLVQPFTYTILHPLQVRRRIAFDRWLVARFSQIDGYRCLSLMRASGVVKCQLALA